jgi:urease accessory protein
MSTESLLSLLQFSDGLFPAGAYAHSFGLECYVQCGQVRDADGVYNFIRANLEGSLGPMETVAMLTALRCLVRNGDLAALLILDQQLEAMKPVEELRSASRQMGRQTIRIAAELTQDRLLRSYFLATESDSTPGHHSVCFGVIAGSLGWSEADAAGAYLFSATSAMVGAALRLLPLGQLRGQRILWEMKPTIQRLAQEAIAKEETEMWSFVPGLEIASMRHAQLDARLFRS